MKKDQLKSKPHIFKAFSWSMKGIHAAFKHEISFRQEVFCGMILIPLGLFLGRTALEKAFLISVLLLVLIVELVNSAIEITLDRISAENHPLTGRAKDMGSAAVFIALVNAAVVWLIILIDRVYP